MVTVPLGLSGPSLDPRAGTKWMYREPLALSPHVYQCPGGKCGYRLCNRSPPITKPRASRHKPAAHDPPSRLLVHLRSSFPCYGQGF